MIKGARSALAVGPRRASRLPATGPSGGLASFSFALGDLVGTSLSNTTGSRRAGGLTLAELVVVMAIIGVLALIGVPRYANSIARYRADVSASRVRADVVQARSLARSTSQGVVMQFDAVAETYEIEGTTGLDRSATYVVELAATPYNSEIVLADFGGGSTLSFNGYGESVSTGRVVIRAGSEYRTIFVASVDEAVEPGNRSTPQTTQDLGGGVTAALK